VMNEIRKTSMPIKIFSYMDISFSLVVRGSEPVLFLGGAHTQED